MGCLWGRSLASHIKLTRMGGYRWLWPNIYLGSINLTIHEQLCLMHWLNCVCALTFERLFFWQVLVYISLIVVWYAITFWRGNLLILWSPMMYVSNRDRNDLFTQLEHKTAHTMQVNFHRWRTVGISTMLGSCLVWLVFFCHDIVGYRRTTHTLIDKTQWTMAAAIETWQPWCPTSSSDTQKH